MSWQCKMLDVVGTRLVELDPEQNGGICGRTYLVTADGVLHDWHDLPVGTMFYVPKDADMNVWPWLHARHLADYYTQHNAHRQPLMVILPGPEMFCVDQTCWDNGRRYGGWTVSGEAPLITVSPSIDLKGFYHGYLTSGVIADDCEGRQFSPDGKRLPPQGGV